MEAAATLGLAGNIIQFLQFGQKLCSTFSQICHSASGITRQNEDKKQLVTAFAGSLDSISDDLAKYCSFLRQDLAGTEKSDLEKTQIQGIIDGCRTVAAELACRINRLCPDGRLGKWKVLFSAIKSMWKERELVDLEQQLDKFQKQLEWRVLLSLRVSLDLLESRREDQFSQMQSSIASIIAKSIQIHLRELPQWPVVDTAPTGSIQFIAQNESYPTVNAPNTADRHPSRQARQDTQSISKAGSIPLELAIATDFAAKLAASEKAVLKSLIFPIMNDRRDAITPAEAATFDWIFREPQKKDRPWTNFHEWLLEGKGIYWVNGKEGSGKSTLMKHLVGHSKTEEALKSWSAGSKLIMASFFFWYNGNELQKSQVGLLRAILYECLKDHRELIPLAIPDTSELGEADMEGYWSLKRLQGAFDKLVSQKRFRTKFCFFVDGLDEYSGLHSDMVELFKSIASQKNVKICTSSRPLLIFEDGFAGSPGLVLQNLTYDDISLYVTKKLSRNEKMTELETEEPGITLEVTTLIVSRASGVFLWVYLVVQSLLDGLGNYDVGHDLKRRLDDLPADIGDLYWHMIQKVQPSWYLEEGFRLLRMTKASRGGLTLLELAFAEMLVEEDQQEPLIRDISWDKQRRMCQRMAGRLKSRCLGLLEVGSNEKLDITDQLVTFIHKSAYDFLGTDKVKARMQSCAGHESFAPEVALVRATFRVLRTCLTRTTEDGCSRDYWFTVARPTICRIVDWAKAAELKYHKTEFELLESVEKVGQELWRMVYPKTAAEEDGLVHWMAASYFPLSSVHPDLDPVLKVNSWPPHPSTITVWAEMSSKTSRTNQGDVPPSREWNWHAPRIRPYGFASFVAFTQMAGLTLYGAQKALPLLIDVENASRGVPRWPTGGRARVKPRTSGSSKRRQKQTGSTPILPMQQCPLNYIKQWYGQR